MWQAFADLSTDGPLGVMGGVGSIPWSAIDRYAARHGPDEPDTLDRFCRRIRARDAAYLKHQAEELKANK